MKAWQIKAIGALLGLAGGLLYYHQVGCIGSCAIWSNPYISAGYGTLLGFLGISMFVDSKKDKKKHDSSQR